MKSTILFSSFLLITSAIPVLLSGCAPRQQAQPHTSAYVSEAEFSRYIQKYPEMGKSVRQGYLSKDAAYSLRYIAPQQKIMDQFTDKVEARRVEVNAMHISNIKKRWLVLEFIRQNQARYVDTANAAGRQAQQAEQVSGHSPFAR